MSMMIGISRANLGSAHSVRTGGEGDVALIIIHLCMDNTALLSSHRGCSKDKIRPTLVLRPSTILSLLLFRQF